MIYILNFNLIKINNWKQTKVNSEQLFFDQVFFIYATVAELNSNMG